MSEIETAIIWLKDLQKEHAVTANWWGACETALEALQEKQERENGCGYCDFSSGAVGATFDGEDDFFMIEHADGVNLCSDGKEFTLTKIKFCPMCGRKIGENDGGQTSN